MLLLLLAQAVQSGVISNSISQPAIIAVPSPASSPPKTPPRAPETPLARDTLFPPLPPVMVSVRVYAGDRLLMADTVRVRRYNASVMLQHYEAPAKDCPAGSSPTVQTSLTFQINREAASAPDEFFMGLTWSRPLDECKIGGSRGISMAQAVTIKPGKTTVVSGDGGLRLEFSRP